MWRVNRYFSKNNETGETFFKGNQTNNRIIYRLIFTLARVLGVTPKRLASKFDAKENEKYAKNLVKELSKNKK